MQTAKFFRTKISHITILSLLTRLAFVVTRHWQRTIAGIVFLMAWGIFAVSASRSPVVTVTVHPDGTFTPSVVNIREGEMIEWINLSPTDSIVQIGNQRLFPTSDPCGIADNNLDHAFVAKDPNEFTGPVRKAVSGIFVLGSNEQGFVQKLSTDSCACETANTPCTPLEVKSLDGNFYKLCPGEGAISQMLDTTWSNPDITGVILRLNWSDIQIDNQGVIEYRWDDLDREMNRAVENGKLFTLDVRAGKDGTPAWIFNNYTGPAAPGPVTPHTFKDWGSEELPPPNSCGYNLTIGSPTDTIYRELYLVMIKSLAAHVASDSRWFQSLAHVKISGANFLSSEARLPKRCYDGDGDGILDTVIKSNDQPDYCVCNTKRWADAGYTPDKLYEYYRVLGNTIHNAFFQRKSMGYQLIQAGFPMVESPTNFQGDSLLDQFGNLILNPQGVTGDDPKGNFQTDTILEEGRNGRFIDPLGALVNLVSGKLFVPQHSGLGRLPRDDNPLGGCSQAVAVDPITQKAIFPISTGTRGDGAPGCPNKRAVEEATLYSQVMGFQTNNPKPGGVTNPADVESALWNLTINSNGVFIELYEQLVWEIYHSRGTGAAAAILDANRRSLVGNPAPYSKNLFTWVEELHERRRELVDPSNPHLQDPFPSIYQHKFTKVITRPETYYYVNPSKCSKTSYRNRVGQITVTP